MVVGAKVCELTDGFLWFVCGLYVGILTSPLMLVGCRIPHSSAVLRDRIRRFQYAANE